MIEILPNWHPLFVHFSVSLLSISVLAFFLSSFAKTYNVQYQARLFARWSLWLGILFTIGTVAAGIHAYYTVNHDTPSHIVMTTHRNLAVGTFVIFLVLSIWSVINARSDYDEGKSFLLTSLAGLVLLLVTAWHGGELVYRYGLGVESLPQVTSEGHGHDHGAHSHGNAGHGDNLMPDAESPTSGHQHDSNQEHKH